MPIRFQNDPTTLWTQGRSLKQHEIIGQKWNRTRTNIAFKALSWVEDAGRSGICWVVVSASDLSWTNYRALTFPPDSWSNINAMWVAASCKLNRDMSVFIVWCRWYNAWSWREANEVNVLEETSAFFLVSKPLRNLSAIDFQSATRLGSWISRNISIVTSNEHKEQDLEWRKIDVKTLVNRCFQCISVL